MCDSVRLLFFFFFATLGTHWVPTHTNTRKHHHIQTAPRRTRARYDANLGTTALKPSQLIYGIFPSTPAHASAAQGLETALRGCLRTAGSENEGIFIRTRLG